MMRQMWEQLHLNKALEQFLKTPFLKVPNQSEVDICILCATLCLDSKASHKALWRSFHPILKP
jgi:hypothetical protein